MAPGKGSEPLGLPVRVPRGGASQAAAGAVREFDQKHLTKYETSYQMRFLTFLKRQRKRRHVINLVFIGAVAIFAVTTISLLFLNRKSTRRRSPVALKAALSCVGKAIDVHNVGSCQKFMTHINDCKHEDSIWTDVLFSAVNEEASALGKKTLRELKLENGKSLETHDPIPSVIYALFDRDQFVFPTCHVGTQYSIDLPSANIRVNATGLQSSLLYTFPDY
jgi:hypothetical protein